MIEARISGARRLVAAFGMSLAVLALTACEDRKETGPDEAAAPDAPEIAAPVPAAVADPAAARPLESFPGMDSDSDGFVTSAEHAKAAQTMFQMLDANKDGTVNVAEMDAVRTLLPDQAGIKAAAESSEKTLTALDSDSDGMLTLAEYVAGSNGMFAKMDANKDDRISRAEWDAAQLGAGATPMATPAAK